jgi:hypothetical protein
LFRGSSVALRYSSPSGPIAVIWGAGLRGLTHDDGQPHGRWEGRERLPSDIFGQDGLESLLAELVSAGSRKHRNLLHAEVAVKIGFERA